MNPLNRRQALAMTPLLALNPVTALASPPDQVGRLLSLKAECLRVDPDAYKAAVAADINLYALIPSLGIDAHLDDGRCESWYQKGKLHREHGPARIHADGSRYWFFHDSLHRDDGPALVMADGSEFWYHSGRLHRPDGPAITRPDGTIQWYLHGYLHREDGPATQTPNGTLCWYRHGELYRDDGPAVVDANGVPMAYLDAVGYWEQFQAVRRP